ncbi:class II aldolase/adducin family protein [Cloacibacillus sp.]|uniref:class II aldolase/adducin family protein n=1 Tax=Cloacibacillus sp. TaxID=2049023 RepID=UPI0025C71FA5|nr:class II aldolase/adducin family protein [Cloacibacillus sp.]MCC8056713.1 class II aldolase/adducin family protein [Cloacibacillus sp.]
MTDLEIREDIINTARVMLQKGLVQGTGGNFSVRCARGFIVTPSGMDYTKLAPSDLPKLSPDGAVLEGERRPSIEKELHRSVYRARRDVGAVIHTHSVYASAAAAMRLPLPVLTDNQAVLFGGAVPVSEYAPIGTPELAYNTAKALAAGGGVLMANHGALCVGATLAEAALRCEMLEIFAKIFFLTKSCGGGVSLTAEDASREASDVAGRYGQR